MMEKPVIICVDDEKFFLDSLKLELYRIFSGKITVELAESGEEALELLYEHKNSGKDIPVIISDYYMPGMKGDSFLREAHKRFPNSKKILLSGMATLDGVRNSINWSNLYRYVLKPFDSLDLELTITEAFRIYYKERTIEQQQKNINDLNVKLEGKVDERTQYIIEKKDLEIDSMIRAFVDLINQSMFSLLEITLTSDNLLLKKTKRLLSYAAHIIKGCNLEEGKQIQSGIMIYHFYLFRLNSGLSLKILKGEAVSKAESNVINNAKYEVYKILKNNPVLNIIALSVNKELDFPEITQDTNSSGFFKHEEIINEIIKIVSEFDMLILKGRNLSEAVFYLKSLNLFNPEYLDALSL